MGGVFLYGRYRQAGGGIKALMIRQGLAADENRCGGNLCKPVRSLALKPARVICRR